MRLAGLTKVDAAEVLGGTLTRLLGRSEVIIDGLAFISDPDSAGNAGTLLTRMSELGIDRALICGSKCADGASPNSHTAAAVQQAPDRLTGLLRLNPWTSAWRADLDRHADNPRLPESCCTLGRTDSPSSIPSLSGSSSAAPKRPAGHDSGGLPVALGGASGRRPCLSVPGYDLRAQQ